MLENPMIKDRRQPFIHYRNPVKEQCGCGGRARYYVYDHREPHCEVCFREAINCAEMVPVQTID